MYSHSQSILVDEREFGDAKKAIVAYSQAERDYESEKDVEVVLIGADSLETVRATHANYFSGTVTSPLLAGLS